MINGVLLQDHHGCHQFDDDHPLYDPDPDYPGFGGKALSMIHNRNATPPKKYGIFWEFSPKNKKIGDFLTN